MASWKSLLHSFWQLLPFVLLYAYINASIAVSAGLMRVSKHWPRRFELVLVVAVVVVVVVFLLVSVLIWMWCRVLGPVVS